MQRLRWLLFGAVVVAMAGVVVFLATWEIPPPTSRVDKTIPHERPRN